MDIVGTGFRCAECGVRAQWKGRGDAVHWTPAQRAAWVRSGKHDTTIGVILLAIAGAAVAFVSTQPEPDYSDALSGWLRLSLPFVAFGIAALIRGRVYKSRAR